jgi:hypothetical protein
MAQQHFLANREIEMVLGCLVSYEVSRLLVPYAYRPGRTPTSNLKLCFRVGYPSVHVQPVGRVTARQSLSEPIGEG